MSATRLSVVIPVCDERENLDAVDEELRAVLTTLPGASEVVYVDDGSRDGSRDLLRELVARHAAGAPRRRALLLRRNYGQTAALAAGFAAAEGAVVVAMDGDGQNDPRDIPRLLARLEEGYDVVSGWRRRRSDHALLRRLPSRVANWVLARLAGLALHDFGCTLKAYRTPLLRQVHLYGDMHRFLPVHLHGVGARVAELEVAHRPRRRGQSKYGPGRVFRVLVDLVLVRFMARYSTRPMHLFGAVGLWFLLAAVTVATLALAFKFGWLAPLGVEYRADLVQTPLPALAVSFGIGGISSLLLGIVAELLIRVLHEARGLPIYGIAESLDSDAAAAGAAPPVGSASR